MGNFSLEIVVLAAGKGTRMRSQMPKVLHQVCGRSLLERTLREAALLSPRQIVVVIGFGQEQMRKELARLAGEPEFAAITLVPVLQARQLGTGHAVKTALPAAKPESELVMIVPGDSPLITAKELEEFRSKFLELNPDLLVLSCLLEDPAAFGRIIRNPSGEVLRIVELKDCSPEEKAVKEINASFYLAKREFLEQALAHLSADNAQGEYYLTDIVAHGVSQGRRVMVHCSENSLASMGANTRSEMSALEKKRREEINQVWMDAGVSFEDPACAYIDEGVEIGADSFIGAGTRIKGKTKLGSGVIIEGESLIRDCELGDGVLVKLGCYLDGASIASACQIGPFAHLRPGTVLHPQVRIGNFVETKKTEIHEGAKANHLTYLGDAEVGRGANVGAGTITCNYDGKTKHRTTIGERSFIGSNTALVAPVEVGDGAYVGAGSTITTDVPARALGVARGRQRNIDNWADKKGK